MGKVSFLRTAGELKKKNITPQQQYGFTPCSPDMTICGDCQDNRSKNKCPRLKEWLVKQRP